MKSACIGQSGTNSFDGELPQFSVPKVITLVRAIRLLSTKLIQFPNYFFLNLSHIISHPDNSCIEFAELLETDFKQKRK